jgi:hypothetical protein
VENLNIDGKNIGMDFKEMGRENVNWINLAVNSERSLVLEDRYRHSGSVEFEGFFD